MPNENEKETAVLDGQQVSTQQLNEAKQNKATRIVEDANKQGEFKTLHRMREG